MEGGHLPDMWTVMLVRATVATFDGIALHIALGAMWAILTRSALEMSTAGFWLTVLALHGVGWVIAFKTIDATQI